MEIYQKSYSPACHLSTQCLRHMSKLWRYSVASFLRHFNKSKLWLILHKQATCYPYNTSRFAYDPCSHMWIKIPRPPIKYNLSLKSSHSNFLHMLASMNLSFSFDPLYISWCHVDLHLCGGQTQPWHILIRLYSKSMSIDLGQINFRSKALNRMLK